ncbi:MAG: alpha/beta fold hydrolase [Verrucomicrobia bacterium]|nr:alpha/beta fold hydrolase [Verrucomicrobiota bacterium]
MIELLWVGLSEMLIYPLWVLWAATAAHDTPPLDPNVHQSPIILVHGRACHQGIWKPLRNFLEKEGYQNIYSLNLDRRRLWISAKTLSEYEEQLDRFIKKVIAETGRKPILIGHSMGGLLSAGAAVRLPESIEAVITLAAPLEGTEMVPWLQRRGLRLNAIDRAMAPQSPAVIAAKNVQVPLYTMSAAVDWVVWNRSSAPTDVSIPWRGHKGITMAKSTFKQIHAWLQEIERGEDN